MFCSNFTVADSHLRYIRGKENLKSFTQSRTIATGNDMANTFCGTCGTLLYRVSSGLPGMSILRIGTVDDFRLAETKLKPQVEQFIGTRAAWLAPVEGVLQMERMHTLEDVKNIP
ncbi:Mss4-like protein [Colletotrichum cereale]|nr:Mss4-like protein [Colletotrichum cereale]